MTRLLVLVLTVVFAGDARADSHVVQRGETLEHVAIGHGCPVEVVLRANHLRTTLVKAGTVVVVPSCARAPARVPRATPEADKARQALAVIDGISESLRPPLVVRAVDRDDQSVGEPWSGALDHAEQLESGEGYVVRRPSRAFGATHVVEYLRHAIAEVRALYPDVHTLAIGDLSAEHGGKISAHRSHQSGLDVDVGFYFSHVPAGYPDNFAPGDVRLDFEATWALLAAFARTSDREDGVEMIFLDYGVQHRLYDWARLHHTPDAELDAIFQYPHGDAATTGLVRHWPGHTDHFHVRFKPAR